MSEFINYGIDLGTTNSCIVRLDGDEIKIIQNADQMNVTPSVVRVLRSGSVMVGRRAYNAIAEDPDNVAAEFKRLMGQKFQQQFPAAGRSMSPEELSAEVLKSMLGDARRRQADAHDLSTAAVITVPAAFTALQCEATARAAALAGLNEYPLLQEPIAAAIAYGARPGAQDQRWLVFDLGGGTLDIAVVSTREGRLSVLEHRGDNHLGGKDIDRLIVQKIFLPALAAQFSLPDMQADGRLLRKLSLIAEYAKIELSTLDETIVSLIDLGKDADGTFIEAELPLHRAQIETEIEPLLARCLQLAADALKGARVKGSDLDRVLLVGGPTQMPFVRRLITETLGAQVDYSLDPMTVVAYGAAIYGSTIERAATTPRVAVATPKLRLRLAFDPVSASLEALVAGKIDGERANEAREVKIETDNNFWTSGWHAINDNYFELPLVLQEGRNNNFQISVRDAQGRALEVEPAEFAVRHGLMISAPPLPHTISVELVQADGAIELSPVFPRRTLLPAEKTVSYRAAKTLRPSDMETSLAIKLWEGEALSEPQANNWVGNMHLRNDHIRRPIPEGAEIQLHIKIDASRLITVEVFVPHLNANFSERVYIPQDEEPDYLKLLDSVPLEIESYLFRLNLLEEQLLFSDFTPVEESFDFPEVLYEEGETAPASNFASEAEAGSGFDAEKAAHASASDNSPQSEIDRMRREIEDLDIEISLQRSAPASLDADAAKGIVERAREIRVRLANLETRFGSDQKSSRVLEAESLTAETKRYVESYGTESQKARFAALAREMERATARRDQRGMRKVNTALKSLRGQILYSQDWFWREWFDYFQRPGRIFINTEEAAKWLAHGAAALQQDDQGKLEEAVRRLWRLEPVEETAANNERSIRPGLKS